MAWELLIDSDRNTGVFICNTADVAFGPLVNMENGDVESFYEWWSEVIGSKDPRSMGSSELHEAVFRWYGIQYEIQFQITLPNGRVFDGKYYPVDFATVDGIYDDDVSEEMHDEYMMEDWSNMMEKILMARECDMEGDDGAMAGYLFPSTSWDEEQGAFVENEDQSASPRWEIIGIKNGSEKVGYSTWTTWNWYQGGKLVATGNTAPWNED